MRTSSPLIQFLFSLFSSETQERVSEITRPAESYSKEVFIPWHETDESGKFQTV